jgi:hypothetical protein
MIAQGDGRREGLTDHPRRENPLPARSLNQQAARRERHYWITGRSQFWGALRHGLGRGAKRLVLPPHLPFTIPVGIGSKGWKAGIRTRFLRALTLMSEVKGRGSDLAFRLTAGRYLVIVIGCTGSEIER